MYQFDPLALSYADHQQTATQLELVGGSSLGDSANASGGDFDTFLQAMLSDGNNSDNLLSDEMSYGFGEYAYDVGFSQRHLDGSEVVQGSSLGTLGDSASVSCVNQQWLVPRISGDSDSLLQNASVISQSIKPPRDDMSYGMKRPNTAEHYEATVSRFKRNSTEVGIKPWSNAKWGSPEMLNQFNHRESITLRQAITGAIQGDNIPYSFTDHTHMGIQPLNSASFFEQAKLHFNNLIKLPLKEFITDPEKESSMENALFILADSFTSFPIEIAEKIVELSMDFPILVLNWKGYCSQSQKYCQQLSAEKENIVATSGENELRVRYEQLEKKEKELITELEAVEKEKEEIDKQEKVKEERFMKIAAEKLDDLSTEWASLQSFFI